MNQNQPTLQGFTLIEFSIVMVIIGLLIAGITVGMNLVQQAEMNSVISDMQNFQTAYSNFLKRYRAVPGDMDNASDFFEQCAQTNVSCNGNGNGLINFAPGIVDEAYSAWRELSLANLISYPIVMIPDSWNGVEIIGSTVPASQLTSSGYIFSGANQDFGDDGAFAFATSPWSDNFTNSVFIAKPSFVGLGNSTLRSEEAFNIDAKIDDGAVNSGAFTGSLTGKFRSITGLDASTTCQNSGDYNLTSKEIICISGFALN